MHCTSEQARQHADEPRYARWTRPAAPRAMIWLPLAMVMVLADFAITLTRFALSPQSAFSASRFWLYALLPGLLLAGFAFGLRLAWYALAAIYVDIQEYSQQTHGAWWQAARRESAVVRRSLLWGPSCSTVEQRQALATGRLSTPPVAQEGVFRLGKFIRGKKTTLDAHRAMVMQALAEALGNWWQEGLPPASCHAWCGRREDWTTLVAAMSARGYTLPSKPLYQGDMAMLEYITDRLHDENNPCHAVLCMGFVSPEPDPARAVPESEAVFALLLTRDGEGVRLHRPVPLTAPAHVVRAQLNAGLDGAPTAYISDTPLSLPLLDEATWQRESFDSKPFWGELHAMQCWITLMMAHDGAQARSQTLGWCSHGTDALWAGIVQPAATPQKETV